MLDSVGGRRQKKRQARQHWRHRIQHKKTSNPSIVFPCDPMPYHSSKPMPNIHTPMPHANHTLSLVWPREAIFCVVWDIVITVGPFFPALHPCVCIFCLVYIFNGLIILNSPTSFCLLLMLILSRICCQDCLHVDQRHDCQQPDLGQALL